MNGKKNLPKTDLEYTLRVREFINNRPNNSTYTRAEIDEMADLYEYKCRISHHGTTCGTCIRTMQKFLNNQMIKLG